MSNSRSQFLSYFRQQADVIEGLKGTLPEETDHSSEGLYGIPTHRKTLMVSLLDCLSQVRFSKAQYPNLNRKVGQRFLRFLEECCGWKESGFISIPILVRRSKESSLPKHLSELLAERISRFSPGDGNYIDLEQLDKPAHDLLELVSTEQHEQLIESCRHCSLVYSMRNHLVHRAQSPGRAIDAIGRYTDKPVYHFFMGEEDLHLLYPFGFLKKLLLQSLDFLDIHLKRFSIDPYDIVEDSSKW